MENAVTTEQKTDTPCIEDEDIFVLNPAFRLRNESNHVKLYSLGGSGNSHLHHTIGIVLALCDGKRTVDEISQQVTSFASSSDSQQALAEAKRKVKQIVDTFLKTDDERRGRGPSPVDTLPSEAPLIPVSLLPRFKDMPHPVYDYRTFLPKYAHKAGRNDGTLRDRVPASLQWHLTSACATDCTYCYLGRRQVASADLLPFDRLMELLEECKEIGVLEVNPSGGDILLYPRLFDVLEAIDANGFLPILISTKAYVSKDMAAKLAAHPIVRQVQYSLDSTVAEVADYLTRTPGFCNRALESIRHLVTCGLSVAVKAVITPYNILTIPRLYRELRDMGVQGRIKLAMYCRSAYHHTDDLFNHPETFQWLDQQARQLRNEFPEDFIVIQNGEPRLEPFPKSEITTSVMESYVSRKARCTAGRTCMMICADGHVIPCEQMPETGDCFVGDVTTQSIQEVWEGQRLHDMTIYPREALRGTPCYECEFFEDCAVKKGFCIRDHIKYYGKIYVTPPECPKSDLPFVRPQ
jgi:radical SAM protein with 4Fe4S-binding SPASM domain